MSNGKMIAVGSLPQESTSKGGLNATVSADERNRKTPDKIGDGPEKGEKGEFKPAAYKTKNGFTRVDH